MLRALLVLVISGPAYSQVNCDTHRIYCAIVKINPHVDRGVAMELSNHLYRYSSRYGTNPLRSVAIAAQESMFRHVSTDQDIGMFQINIGTIEAYNIDRDRLETDFEYAVRTHVWLLAKKKEYCADLEEEAWTCYHSRTEKHRLVYRDLVNRYFELITAEEERV